MKGMWLAALWSLMLGMVGCGGNDQPRLQPVKGKLTINGKPAGGLYVVFTPIGATRGTGAMDRTQPDGRFALVSRGGIGAAAGEYKVTVRADSMMADGSDRPKGKPMPVIPKQFSQTDQSTLTKVVPEGGGTIDIDITLSD
jgi:hypothetical protein